MSFGTFWLARWRKLWSFGFDERRVRDLGRFGILLDGCSLHVHVGFCCLGFVEFDLEL